MNPVKPVTCAATSPQPGQSDDDATRLLELASLRKGSDAAESMRRILNGGSVTVATDLRPDPRGNRSRRSRRSRRKDEASNCEPDANR